MLGHPAVRTPQPRSPRRRGRPLPQPLRPGRSVRAEPSLPADRSVPLQSPGGAQRDTARRPLHQPRARGPGARLRPGAVRLHRPEPRSPRARPRRPAPAHLRGRPARDSVPSSTSPSICDRGGSGSGLGATTCPTTSASCTSRWTTSPARPRDTTPTTARPRSSPSRCSRGSTTRATRPGSRTRPTSGRTHPSSRPTPYHAFVDPADVDLPVRRATWEEEAAQHLFLAGASAIRSFGVPPTKPGSDSCAPTYYGLMAEVDDKVGRLIDGLRDRDLLDRTLSSSRRITARCSATTGSPRSSATSTRRTTSRSSSAIRGRWPTRRGARWSTASPRTST